MRRLTGWNQVIQQRINAKEEAFEKRAQANDYSRRMTKEIYEDHCRQWQWLSLLFLEYSDI